ncbi:MAG TPA: CNNM domain-containing protein, partial [Solirubrobacterales bacterium]|nr:CNNM domain-containing protein [Solirubrobacterales bacterium]
MTAVFLVLLFLLIAANGFFVAAEFALVRSRRSRLEQLASDGSGSARAVIDELDHIDEYLAACQLGIT